MKQFIIILLTIVASTGLVRADENKVLLDSALAYFQNKDFARAIEAYESIRAKNLQSPELYYNLGNAYYKIGDISSAILNYERAKLLMPDDEDIAFNLELANKHVVDKIEIIPEIYFVSWFKGFIMRFTSDVWALGSLGLFVAFLLLIFIFLFSGNVTVKKICFGLGIIFIICSVVSFSFAFQNKKAFEEHKTAIVFEPSVTIKSSPDASGNNLFVIHEGLKVEVIDKVGDWLKIKLADGNVGWIEAGFLQMI